MPSLRDICTANSSPPLELEHFLDMRLTTGGRVRDVSMRGGHYLVYKIPMADSPFLALPDSYKSKAVRNIVSIKGFIVRATAPYRRKVAKQYWVWDKDQEMEMPRHKIVELPEAPGSALAGECVLYNSYNVAKITVHELDEPLVVIREVDMMATWNPEYDRFVGLGDHTMAQKAYEHFPGIDGAGSV